MQCKIVNSNIIFKRFETRTFTVEDSKGKLFVILINALTIFVKAFIKIPS